MDDLRIVKVNNWFDKEVEKTLKQWTKLWVGHADLYKLVICNGTSDFDKTNKMVESIRSDIKELAEYYFEYLYAKQQRDNDPS